MQTITIDQFKSKFHVSSLDPWTSGVFTPKDIQLLRSQSGFVKVDRKLVELIKLIPVFLREPVRIIKNINELLRIYSTQVVRYYNEKEKKIKDTFPFSDYALKASIIASFKPKRLLEIGTDRGWAITAFKSVLPGCQCFTMEYRRDQDAGIMVRKKPKLKIRQIWADSLKYDYARLSSVDVAFIDGNHHYRWVYSDLLNTNKITTKAIILDDYIPGKKYYREATIAWADYFLEVVAAVSDFFKKNSNDFTGAYWLKDTRICVLIKR